MTTKIEAIIKELEANACIVNGILEIPLRQVKMTLEKHLQDTEECNHERKYLLSEIESGDIKTMVCGKCGKSTLDYLKNRCESDGNLISINPPTYRCTFCKRDYLAGKEIPICPSK